MRLILDDDKRRIEEAFQLISGIAHGRSSNERTDVARAETLLHRVTENMRQLEKAGKTLLPRTE